MVMDVTEQASSQSKLEVALSEPSTEDGDTSEELAEETTETPEVDETEGEPEEPEGIKWSEEQQAEIGRLVQAESDKKANTYRERHESNSELIKTLQQELTEAKRQVSGRTGEARLKKLLQDYDNEGLPEEGKKTFEEEIKTFNQKIDEYNSNVEQVEATVKFVDEMAKNIDPAIAKQFYLTDPNPNIRAGGGIDIINEAIANIKEYKNFLLVLEHFYPGGSEVRDAFAKTVKALGDNEKDFPTERSKKNYLSSAEVGFKPPRPRKAPPAPSQSGGGEDLSQLNPREAIEKGLENLRKKQGK